MAPKLLDFTEEELSPKVRQLLEVLRYQTEMIVHRPPDPHSPRFLSLVKGHHSEVTDGDSDY